MDQHGMAEGRFQGKPRVLIVAFSCNPELGSEPAAGWGLTRAVSEFAETVVLVEQGHLAAIRRWQAAHPGASGTYVGVPQPRWAPSGKRSRIGWFISYLAWLPEVSRVGRRLHMQRPFDLVYHASYSTYWLPSPVGRFGVPSVWGPVGGAATTPVRLWPVLGWWGLLIEWFDWAAVRAAAAWPGTRRTWREVSVRIVQNEETLARLPRRLQAGTRVLNHVLFLERPQVEPAERSSHLLYISALESRKGPALAIRALAETPEDVRLLVVGDGPERPALQQLARRLGVSRRVEFLGRVPRSRVSRLLSSAAAVVFTGLREEGGCSLAEAMLAGAPVIVLANGGARTVARSTTAPDRVVLVEPADVKATARRIAEAITRFSRRPCGPSGSTLDQRTARQVLRACFAEAMAAGTARCSLRREMDGEREISSRASLSGSRLAN